MKIGDKVKVIKDKHKTCGHYIGLIGEIFDIRDDEITVEVVFNEEDNKDYLYLDLFPMIKDRVLYFDKDELKIVCNNKILNEYGICEKCEKNIKIKNEVVDFDGHMKILNFLTYLQGIGIINETQRIEYSKHIQNYLKEKKDNLDFLEEFLDLIKNKSL